MSLASSQVYGMPGSACCCFALYLCLISYLLVQASGRAKEKMAAVVGADSEAEPEDSESEFEPAEEAQAESEVPSLSHAWPCVKAWHQAELDSMTGMPSIMPL